MVDVTGFLRGVRGRGQSGYQPYTRWQTSDSPEVRDNRHWQWQPGRILVGCDRPSGRLLGRNDNRHMMTVAGSRSGKGVSCMIPNALTWPGSMLIIDPKGELAGYTARHRPGKVYVLDPFGVTADRVKHLRACHNPLRFVEQADEDMLFDAAALIADAIVVRSGEGDSHWNDTAQALLQGLLVHVAKHPAYEGRRNLITLQSLLAQGKSYDKRDGIDGILSEMFDEGHQLAKDAAAEMFDRSEAERDSVLSTARRHCNFLKSQAMAPMLEGHNFDLRDLKHDRAGVTVYLCLPAGRMATHARWFRIMLNLLLEEVAGITQGGSLEDTASGHPVLVLLDEFAALGYLKQLEVAAGLVAGYGVRLWTVLQDLGQLKSLYKDRWETFVGNCGVLQFFGNSDSTTCNYIVELLGKTSFRLSSEQRSGAGQGLSESTQVQVQDLMTASEVRNHFSRNYQNQIIIAPPFEPIAMDRLLHYKDFAGKYDE